MDLQTFLSSDFRFSLMYKADLHNLKITVMSSSFILFILGKNTKQILRNYVVVVETKLKYMQNMLTPKPNLTILVHLKLYPL